MYLKKFGILLSMIAIILFFGLCSNFGEHTSSIDVDQQIAGDMTESLNYASLIPADFQITPSQETLPDRQRNITISEEWTFNHGKVMVFEDWYGGRLDAKRYMLIIYNVAGVSGVSSETNLIKLE